MMANPYPYWHKSIKRGPSVTELLFESALLVQLLQLVCSAENSANGFFTFCTLCGTITGKPCPLWHTITGWGIKSELADKKNDWFYRGNVPNIADLTELVKIKIKSRSTASARLSAYPLITDRQKNTK